MENKATTELEKKLNRISASEIDGYFKENGDYLADGDRPFYHYMKKTVRAKGLFLKNVYIAAGISDSYGGAVVRMEAHSNNRDLIIRLCIAGHFLLDEINTALKLYGFNPLYAKDKRDVCLIVAVNQRKYELDDIDKILEEHGFLKLSTEEI